MKKRAAQRANPHQPILLLRRPQLIDGNKVIALIPARGGSKGFPGKNLALLGGKSLVRRAVEVALDSRYVDRVIISSDDHEIIKEAQRAGAEAPFVRPTHLAVDEATTQSVAVHALDALNITNGYLLLLQTTSPLRTVKDVDGCLEKCHRTKSPACASVVQIEKYPSWMFFKGTDDRLIPVIPATKRPSRRQEALKAYVLNGAVYVVKVEIFRQQLDFLPNDTVCFEMPKNRSVDIDIPQDLIKAGRIYRESINV